MMTPKPYGTRFTMNNKKDNHVAIMQWFKIQARLEKVYELKRQNDDSVTVCSRCFLPDCNCKQEKDSLDDAIGQLRWWAEICLREGNSISDDLPIPKWVWNNEGSQSGLYRAVPVIDGAEVVAGYRRNKVDYITWENEDGTIETKEVPHKFDNVWYGYLIDDPIGFATFENGYWHTPEIDIVDAGTYPEADHWYIPYSPDPIPHTEFVNRVLLVKGWG